MKKEHWPELAYKEAKQTYDTMHRWAQIVGKVKLARLPWMNHSWHLALLVTPTGLTTGDIPGDSKHFQINFDFRQHQLQIITSKLEERIFDLRTLSVASCYHHVLTTLNNFGIACEINPIPCEIPDAVPFHLDDTHSAYDPLHAADWHQALLNADEVFTQFRAEFIGKSSPVHLFWGSFDLAVSRFSGKTAPLHPGGFPNLPDWVAQEAYSHEVCSCGFWPGSEGVPFAAFYSYIYPEPEGYKTDSVAPKSAYYNENLREFLLPYEAVRTSGNPSKTLLDFLRRSTYDAAADRAEWDKERFFFDSSSFKDKSFF